MPRKTPPLSDWQITFLTAPFTPRTIRAASHDFRAGAAVLLDDDGEVIFSAPAGSVAVQIAGTDMQEAGAEAAPGSREEPQDACAARTAACMHLDRDEARRTARPFAEGCEHQIEMLPVIDLLIDFTCFRCGGWFTASFPPLDWAVSAGFWQSTAADQMAILRGLQRKASERQDIDGVRIEVSRADLDVVLGMAEHLSSSGSVAAHAAARIRKALS